MPSETSGRGGAGMVDCATVAIPTMDECASQAAHQGAISVAATEVPTASPINTGGTPNLDTHQADGLPLVREQLRERGVSSAGTDIIMASWRPATAKQYRPHIHRWLQFCGRKCINSLNPAVADIVNFLADTYHRGVGYNVVNTARGALSSLGIVVDGCRAGNHPLVNRLLKGVFNLRPSAPRFAETWDIQPVLQHLRTMDPLPTLSLKDLTFKLVMLMALTQAARMQTLHLLLLSGILIKKDSISVMLRGHIKQCRPDFNVKTITFHAYSRDSRLCVCDTLKFYVAQTEKLRSFENEDESLLISFIKPHKGVSKDTIARWIRSVLHLSGIDTVKYSAGSVRSAAASKAKSMNVPIMHIMAKAGWSREATFAKYYDKEIVSNRDIFQDAVLM